MKGLQVLEQSKSALAEALATERTLAETTALRYLASELEENLIPVEKAFSMAEAHREAENETRQRAVFGILLGLRSAKAQGYHFEAQIDQAAGTGK